MSNGSTRLFISALLTSSFICLAPSAVLAANSVKIAGHTVISIKAGAGQSIDQRTQRIQTSLDNALAAATDLSPAAVKVSKSGANYLITLGGYKIIAVDSANAKAAKTTVPVLAQRWALAIKKELANTDEVASYVASLGGNSTTANSNEPQEAPPRVQTQNTATINTSAMQGPPPVANNPYGQSSNPYGQPSNGQQYMAQNSTQPMNIGQTQSPMMQGRVVMAPAGMTIPITLATALSTEVAHAGDPVQANVSQDIDLGQGRLPAGSVVVGVVTDAEPGRRLDRSGVLSFKFTTLRTPDGIETPISAHLVGGIGKYANKGNEESDTVHGEGMKNKVESLAIRGAVGAGGGAALGTAVGAIAGGGHGAGKGAWSGAAIGAGLGVADSLLIRKAADVMLPSGTRMELQLDQAANITFPVMQ